jgi:hypothetical protein
LPSSSAAAMNRGAARLITSAADCRKESVLILPCDMVNEYAEAVRHTTFNMVARNILCDVVRSTGTGVQRSTRFQSSPCILMSMASTATGKTISLLVQTFKRSNNQNLHRRLVGNRHVEEVTYYYARACTRAVYEKNGAKLTSGF